MATPRERFARQETDLWKMLCDELGAKRIHLAQGHQLAKVVAKVGQWVITLDEHNEPGYRAEYVYTRLRAPFANPDRLRFSVSHQTVFANIGRLVGMQDIKVKHQPFDKMFLVQGSDPNTIKTLFDDDRLRELVKSEPGIHLQVRDAGNWFEDYFPDDVDELVLEVEGDVKDYDRLKRLFDLFARVMNDLCKLGSAYER